MTVNRVICIDDRNPNPLCSFPRGYVVRGSVYRVTGTGPFGGFQINGLPVIGVLGLDVGWKRQRFRELLEPTSQNTTESDECLAPVSSR